MMNKRLYPIILLIMLTFSSCVKKNIKQGIFCDHHEVITEVAKDDTITGELLINKDTTINTFSINVAGNYLLMKTGEANKIITVYDLDGKYVGAFGNIGNARNEFTEGYSMNNQCINGNVWGRDRNVRKLYSFSIDASLKAKTPVIAKSFDVEHGANNAFYVNDTTIVYDCASVDNISLKTVNPVTKTSQGIELFKPQQDAMNIYAMRSAINLEKGVIAMGMQFVNQMNFISIKGQDKKSVSLYKDATIVENYEDRTIYYGCVAPTDKYVCALYANLPMKNIMKGMPAPNPREIHVFDWDGNFRKKIVLKENVSIITFDKNNNMYGLTEDGEVYKYKNVLN